jgi:DNA transposition AAA+ family ATPase
MTNTEAKAVAEQLGNIPDLDPAIQAAIERLNRKGYIPLHQVQIAHNWLEGKQQSRQSGRVVGDSRTGKSMMCDAYRLRHKPQQVAGKPPIVPVVYVESDEECGAKDLFKLILKALGHKLATTNRSVAEIRDFTMSTMAKCGVKMLIIDEAELLKPKTFSEARHIFDKLQISVILVGTDRLDTAIKRDDRVHNRFRSCYQFGNLSGIDFERTVKIWEKQVLQLPTPSNLHSKEKLKILGEATLGYVGLMDMILREAAIQSLKKGLVKIDLKTLKEVAMEYR